MKKVLLVLGAVAIMAGFASCAKYTDCKCTYKLGGVEVSKTYTAAEMEKKQKTCKQWETAQQSVYPDIQCRRN
ncbi:MAG: hypothetical protein ACTTKO_07460 [Candidatus Limimorpha sp.]